MSEPRKSPLSSSGDVVDVYLNLTPLMDVMSNILFFLLSAFGASAVAVFSVTVPVDATSETSDAPAEDKVTVTMRADSTGVTLGCQDPMKLPDELKICSQRIGKKAGAYDLPGINGALKTIKEKFPGASSVIFVPDDDIKYQTLVKLLDAARDFKKGDKKLPLFPEVVMSSLVK